MNANDKPPSPTLKKSSIFSLLNDDKEPCLNESNTPYSQFFPTHQQTSTSSLTEQSPSIPQRKRSVEDVQSPMLLPSISSQLNDPCQNLPTSKRPKNDDECSQYNIPLSKESVMDVASLLLDLDRRDKVSSTPKHNDETTGGALPVSQPSNRISSPILPTAVPREYFNNISLSAVGSAWYATPMPMIPVFDASSPDSFIPRRSSSLPNQPTSPPQYNVAFVHPSASYPLPAYKQTQVTQQQEPIQVRRKSFPNTQQLGNNNNPNNIPTNNNNSPVLSNNIFPGSQRTVAPEEKMGIPIQSRSTKAVDAGKEVNQFTHTYFDDQWMTHYRELARFKAIYGHVNVTRTLPEWRSLGNWVAEQRRKMRKGKLSRQQFEMLREIGFEWDRSYYFKAAVPSVYAADESPKT